MISWISANLATICICILLLAAVTAILVSMAKNRKKGKSACGCGCAGCPMQGACHPKPSPARQNQGSD